MTPKEKDKKRLVKYMHRGNLLTTEMRREPPQLGDTVFKYATVIGISITDMKGEIEIICDVSIAMMPPPMFEHWHPPQQQSFLSILSSLFRG